MDHVLTPVVIFVSVLPWTKGLRPWSVVRDACCGRVLLVPLLINVHRELFMHAVDGANDNARVIAAMLGAMELTEPSPSRAVALHEQLPIRRTVETAVEADV